MTDHRRNDSNLKYANKQILNSDAGFYNKDYRGSDAYYKKGNDFLNKGKRYREEQEGKIIFYVLGPNNPIDSVNMVSNSGREPVISNSSSYNLNNLNNLNNINNINFQKKKDLSRKIIENSNIIDESIRDNPYLKNCADNIKNFNLEDFSKFFQVLANMQYILSLDSEGYLGKNKDMITVNEKLINYNSENINLEEESCILESEKDINKIIIKKDIPLKNILKGEKLNLLISSNNHDLAAINSNLQQNMSNSPQLITFKYFFEDLLKTVKKENLISHNLIKNLLKIYSNFVFNNGIISFNSEDKLLLDFIIENSLIEDSESKCFENFYSVVLYWLLQDFLNFERDIRYDYADERNNNLNVKRRYDSVLGEILSRIENHKELFEIQSWMNFIENLPRINDKVIENLIHTSDKIILLQSDRMRKESAEKKSLIDQLPHLKLMKNVYLKLKRPSALSEKILMKFLDLTKSSDSHVIASSILFLKSHVFPFGKYEIEKIKEFAMNQFKDLMKINEATPAPENLILSKYPLYFFLIQMDKDLIIHLPIIYSNSHEIVRTVLNKDIDKILKGLDTFYAEKVINECSENCLPIVLKIIEGKLFKHENMLSNNRSLADNKLFRRIKTYYNNTNYVELLVSLCDKIPLKEFFKIEDNFVWEKIKNFDTKKLEENNIKIFIKLNTTKNEGLFKNLFSEFVNYEGITYDEGNILSIFNEFHDKIGLYILSILKTWIETTETIQSDSQIIINAIKNLQLDLIMFLKYYKLLKSERFTETLEKIITVLLNNYKKIDNSIFLKFITIIMDQQEKWVKEIKEKENIQDEEKEIEYNLTRTLLISNLRDFLNLSILSKEISDNFINELIHFIACLTSTEKEIFFKSLDERLKNQIRTKDFIVFKDI